jgi:hypothetical protein
MAKEEWKILKENVNYSISSFGNIKNNKTNVIRKLQKGTNGYLKTEITVEKNKRKTFYIHRLVAKYFIPNLGNKEQVNHIDCNKENNNVTNLEWCTQGENNKHIYKMGNKISPAKGLKGKDNWRSVPVVQFIKGKPEVFASITDAAKANNIKQSAISNYLRRNKTRKSTPRFVYLEEHNGKN